MTLERVKVAVEKFKAAEAGVESVVSALQDLLQEGLKGNRAVTGSVWSVVTAATRAFPIQLSPAVEKAQAVTAYTDTYSNTNLVAIWLLQATADGSLIILLQKLQSQPQILTAYDRSAPIRQTSTVQQLVQLLQQLKEYIQETPYDQCLLQQQQRQQQQQPTAPIYIQTEHDLQRHSHHSDSSSSEVHVNYVQPQSGVPASHVAVVSGDTSSRSGLSAQQSATAAAEHSNSQGSGASELGSTGKKLLLGAFGRKSSSQNNTTSNSSSSSRTALQKQKRENPVGQQQQQVGHVGAAAGENMVCMQIEVLDSSSILRLPQQQQQVVAVHLQVLPETANTTTSSSSSISKFPGAGAAGAVKGLLHGLQQSATQSLQQSAAAGQDLTGAVAAAGGAMAAAMSQPLAAVKSLASAASGRVGRKMGSSSKSSSSSQSKGHTESAADAAAAVEVSGRSVAAERTGLEASSLYEPQQQQTVSNSSHQTVDHLVQVRLAPAADDGSQQLLHCSIAVNNSAAAAAAVGAAADNTSLAGHGSSTSNPQGWRAKSLINRFSSSMHRKIDKELQQQQQLTAAADSDAATADGGVLEGDMWSVLARLRKNSNQKLAAAEGAVGDHAAAAATATDQAAGELAEQGRQLHQQLLMSCRQVAAAAAATKGCLGDENTQLLECIDLLKQLLNHGLKQTTAAAAADSSGGKGAAGFGSWLGSKHIDAFGVLQSLQQGSKHQPRLMLGADSISAMQAAKSASSSVKLDLWLRASLNEQLLCIRLTTLVSNQHALQQWYHDNALIRQQQQMHEVVQQVGEMSGFRFALLVEAPAAAAAGSSGKGAVMDARKLLGGFSRSLGALRPGSSSSSMAAAAAVAPGPADRTQSTTAAAAAVDDDSVNDSRSSSSIPTFLWAALGSSSSSSAAAAAGQTGNASIFKRSQRRLARILEVRVPPTNSAAVLSRDNSCALSPVSTPGDAAYAEWWSPNNSWQDIAAAAAAGSKENSQSGRDSFGVDDYAIQDIADSGDATVLLPPGASIGSTAAGVGSRSLHAAAAAAAAAASEQGVDGSKGTGVRTAAAKELEQELAAAMAAPLQVLFEHSRRTQGSSRSSHSSGGGSKSAELHRSSSSGWDAAVAAARSRGRKGVGTSVGVCGQQHHDKINVRLHRRSRSPDAMWPAAAPAAAAAAGWMVLGSSGGKEGASASAAAAAAASDGAAGDHGHVGAASRRGLPVRHFHQRSSSLNDLPDLAALLESGDV